MVRGKLTGLAQLVSRQESAILDEWLESLASSGTSRTGRIQQAELQTQCRNFLELLKHALDGGESDIASPPFNPVLDLLGTVSRSRALQGFTPAETATFVFSLKDPLFNASNRALAGDAPGQVQAVRDITSLIDQLGLHTINVYQKSREEVIVRQQREISELSTPVVKLWDGILALPVIGTLDSERTQVVMENLLQTIVDQGAEIAIIDITGVSTVDTLTAQHLLKTIAAARLMGADCIISGIRPQIAQTMVHLGVELNVISKATLADAFAVALRRLNRGVFAIKPPATSGHNDARSAS
jgi:rsbT co-antagonist protein RsbR